MLIEIPDTLLQRLAKTQNEIKKLSGKSNTDRYWSAVGEYEDVSNEIIQHINTETLKH